MATLGERCLDVALAEFDAGVCEEPPGSNTSPRIREYLAPCVRGDRNINLNLVASNWCCAFASWCCHQAVNLHDRAPPHGYRAGVIELIADVLDPHARWTGLWKPIAEVRSGLWVPKPGDLAIYDRSDPGRPETSWWRHVNRVVSFEPDAGTFVTIGGNENQMITIDEQPMLKHNLLGFIAYPQDRHIQSKEMLSEDERSRIVQLVYQTIDGMLRESVWKQTEEEEG